MLYPINRYKLSKDCFTIFSMRFAMVMINGMSIVAKKTSSKSRGNCRRSMTSFGIEIWCKNFPNLSYRACYRK